MRNKKWEEKSEGGRKLGENGKKRRIIPREIRIQIFYFCTADPDPTRVKKWRVIIMLVIASPPAKTKKIEPEKIKSLSNIFSY